MYNIYEMESAQSKLDKIKEQSKARQKTYLADPEKAAKHAAANKASYLKRKAGKAAALAKSKEEPKKEESKKDAFANPYASVSDAKPDEKMVKELKRFTKNAIARRDAKAKGSKTFKIELTEKQKKSREKFKVKRAAEAKAEAEAKAKAEALEKEKAKEKPKKKFIILKDNFEYLEKIINEKIQAQASRDTYLTSLKRLFKLFDETFLSKIYKKTDLIPTIKTQIKAEKGIKGRGVSAVTADLQTLLKMNDIAKLDISDELIKKIKLAHDSSKIETLDKASEKEYPPLEEYFKKMNDTYSKDSKQVALAELMIEVPTRDDLILKVVDSVKAASDQETNYIVMNKSPTARIILHRFKTDKHFGKLDKPLSTRLTNILKKYLNTKKEDDREYLFGDKKLSKFVGDMNKKMGYPKGGINLLRHMAVQKFLSVPRTADEKAEYADMMKHSPQTQTKYNMNKKID